MASKSVSAAGGVGSVERLASTAMRAVSELASAVGEGLKARNEYVALVGQGADPATAVATAIKHSEIH